MRILVIGSGAREHAICWKLKQSNLVSKIYCAPANAGIAQVAEPVNIQADNIDELLQFVKNQDIDITIVGPEQPLVLGIVDKFCENNLKIYGPTAQAAQLEGSKAFSKDFMTKYNIPTAKYQTFSDHQQAINQLNTFNFPLVVKASGLAAGKGVIICQTREEAENAINEMMISRKFDNAGETIVIEEFLEGTEASLLCFVSGSKIIPMESARDYKRAYDHDMGPNTGGMGNFSPNPLFNNELEYEIKTQILDRISIGLQTEKIDYYGVLFIGLMITSDGCKVLEFNVRFGDPETEVVLPRLKSDLFSIIIKSLDGNLNENDIEWKSDACVTVIAASGGYPEAYEKSKIISGLNDCDSDVLVFHAGTKLINNQIVTNGGRVLAITALGNDVNEARNKVYQNIKKINFDGMFYRKDIALI